MEYKNEQENKFCSGEEEYVDMDYLFATADTPEWYDETEHANRIYVQPDPEINEQMESEVFVYEENVGHGQKENTQNNKQTCMQTEKETISEENLKKTPSPCKQEPNLSYQVRHKEEECASCKMLLQEIQEDSVKQEIVTESEKCLGEEKIYWMQGSFGDDVRKIQKKLKTIRFDAGGTPNLEVDGIYGGNTAKAVMKFQKIWGIKESGTVDTATLDRLQKIISIS